MSNVIAFKRQAGTGAPDALQISPTSATTKPEGRGSLACTCGTAPRAECMACVFCRHVQIDIARRQTSSRGAQ